MAECYNLACPYCVDYKCKRTATCDMRLDGEYVKVKHGQWVYVKTIINGEKEYKCSECNALLYCYGTPKQAHYDYCYMCGAKMDLDEVEE